MTSGSIHCSHSKAIQEHVHLYIQKVTLATKKSTVLHVSCCSRITNRSGTRANLSIPTGFFQRGIVVCTSSWNGRVKDHHLPCHWRRSFQAFHLSLQPYILQLASLRMFFASVREKSLCNWSLPGQKVSAGLQSKSFLGLAKSTAPAQVSATPLQAHTNPMSRAASCFALQSELQLKH